MEVVKKEFKDLLVERRKDYDFLWVSRNLKIVPAFQRSGGWLYSRKDMIKRILANADIKHMIVSVAHARKVPVATVQDEAHNILEEIAGKLHWPTVRWLGLILTKVLKRIFMSIRLNENVLCNIKNEMRLNFSQYVYVPTHRSYLDFILLSYVLFSYDMAIPNIASGMDFYHMKFVGEALRNLGAFYMRRSFVNDPFYKELFKAYIGMLVLHSDRAIEFFIEGTRSRTQKSLPPKYGLLSMILECLFKSQVPNITFIPVSISYDKPLEELLFVYELLGVPKPVESTTGLFRSLSILKRPMAYGHVYFKFAPPISGDLYITQRIRFEEACDPSLKLSHDITKRLAYDIIESQKQNTILTPFNLIALLFNQRVYTHPKEVYSVDNLLQDYKWIKNILVKKFNVTLSPAAVNAPVSQNKAEDIDKCEILESLETHKDLIGIDSENNLKLNSRHFGVSQYKSIKGYPLSQETMKLAVPTINVMIYVNPVFAYLAKPAIAALCIKASSKERILQRYYLLRSLLSAEFALPTIVTEAEIYEEGEKLVEFLLKEVNIEGPQEDSRSQINSLLFNLVLPFVGSLHTICTILLEWKDASDLKQKTIVIECQRRAEELLYQDDGLNKHPYSLSLDIYASFLSSLLMCGHVTLDGNCSYKCVVEKLEITVGELTDILKQCSNGSYLDSFPSIIPSEILNLQAKL